MNLNKDIQFISKKDLTEAITLFKGNVKGRVPQNGYEDVYNAINENVNTICSNYNYNPLESKNINIICNAIYDSIVYYNTLNTTRI